MTAQYAFYIFEDQTDDIPLAITDLEYFKSEGFASDWHLEHLVEVPDFMYEISEGLFVSSKDKKNTQSALKKLGFVEDADFSKIMAETNKV